MKYIYAYSIRSTKVLSYDLFYILKLKFTHLASLPMPKEHRGFAEGFHPYPFTPYPFGVRTAGAWG